MPLRLIEMVLPGHQVNRIEELLREQPVVETWYVSISANQTRVTILVSAEEAEPLMDLLDKHFSIGSGFRLILLPVMASMPRVEKPEEALPKKTEAEPQKRVKIPKRVSREELYAQISDASDLSFSYCAMVVLSAVVAAIGLLNNNVAAVIGAMVIAPLLGPNMALALATTLGDLKLTTKSLKTNMTGILIGLAFSVILGFLFTVNTYNPQIAPRTHIALSDVVLALCSGIAGAIAFTTGAPTALIGVMVAVALIPPLVTLGLMLGSNNFLLALGALWLLLTNIICINLAGVITFWVQGIRPTTWWEANIAKKSTAISLLTSAVLLLILISIIFMIGHIEKYR